MNYYSNVTALYVSQKSGNDSHLGISPTNDRIINGPFKTLERALKIVADIRHLGFKHPIDILMLDDEYRFAEPLSILRRDPNRASRCTGGIPSNITIRPYGNNRVLFSGGRKITDWKDDTFNGIECISAYLPDVEAGKWDFTDLYINSKPAKRTLTPSVGFYYPEKVECESQNHHVGSSWFVAKKEDIPANIKSLDDAEIIFHHYWVTEHSKVRSFDPLTRTVYFTGKSRMTISCDETKRSVMEYYIENLPEAFRSPGEWYLDRHQGKLYYIPKDGETSENIIAYAPVVDRIISINGDMENDLLINGICLKDIDFSYTKGDRIITVKKKLDDGSTVDEAVLADAQSEISLHGVVNFEGASCCTIEDCGFYAFGSHAVVIGKGCHDCRVQYCKAEYGGGGGVQIRGGAYSEPEYTHSHHNFITDCSFKNLGLRWFSSPGILISHGYCNEISHNEIAHLFYSGISVGWRWGYGDTVCHDNIISKNHIYDIGQGLLSDMGGIYTLGSQIGTRIEDNLIHDIKSRHYGGWALYTDEGSSHIRISGNICYNCTSNCYNHHYGSTNTVSNNIFAFSKGPLIQNCVREGHDGILVDRNILVMSNDQEAYSSSFLPFSVASDRNYIISAEKDPIMTLCQNDHLKLSDIQNTLGLDVNSIVLSPDIFNADKRDFSISPDSEIYKLGFRQLKLSDVGPRR